MTWGEAEAKETLFDGRREGVGSNSRSASEMSNSPIVDIEDEGEQDNRRLGRRRGGRTGFSSVNSSTRPSSSRVWRPGDGGPASFVSGPKAGDCNEGVVDAEEATDESRECREDALLDGLEYELRAGGGAELRFALLSLVPMSMGDDGFTGSDTLLFPLCCFFAPTHCSCTIGTS
jgi:hypothetical protein